MDRPTFAASLGFYCLACALALATASCITPGEFDQKIPNDAGSVDQTSMDGTVSDVTGPDTDPDADQDLTTDEVDDVTTEDTAGQDVETLDTDATDPDVEVFTCEGFLTACGETCVDLLTDSDNCGNCGVVCANQTACVAGGCTGCLDGWADCDTQTSNGCEANLNTADHCNGCAQGANCDIPGIAQVCSPEADGGGFCELTCAEGYFDLDNRINTSGCEIGFVLRGTATLVGLVGAVVESTVDQETGQVFVATFDSGPKLARLYAISAASGVPIIVGESTPETTGTSDVVGLAAYGNIVVMTAGDKVIGYEYATGTFSKFAASTLTGANAAAAVRSPTLAVSVAEFVVVGASDLEWLAVVTPDDQAASGLGCEAIASNTDFLICSVASQPFGFAALATAQDTSLVTQWVTVVGTTASEFQFMNDSGTKSLFKLEVSHNSSNLLEGATELMFTDNQTLVAVNGPKLAAFLYSPQSGAPTGRYGDRSKTMNGAGVDLALIDTDANNNASRAVVATSAGATVVLIGPSEITSGSLTTTPTQAVVVANHQLFVFEHTGPTTVYDIVLN